MSHLTLKNLEERLQEGDHHWPNNDPDRAESGNSAENTQQSEERMDVRLAVQDVGFDHVVSHRNESDPIDP